MKYRPYIISTALLLLQAVLFIDPCAAQDKYFRYFELEAKSLSESQTQKLEADFEKHEFMHVHATCIEKKKFVIAVDAQYPKRIEDMTEDVREMAEGVLKSRNIASLNTVPASERDLSCQ
ncbi:MAG: hypothetical protein ABR572_00365 [Cryomorphaceae bacterium]|nr:hypothetical protein [Flavobacteriales bacterium]